MALTHARCCDVSNLAAHPALLAGDLQTLNSNLDLIISPEADDDPTMKHQKFSNPSSRAKSLKTRDPDDLHTMADEKIPLVPPPDYDSAVEHGIAQTGAPAPSSGPRPPLPLNLPALNMLRGQRVILASASPRRKQLLAQV